MRGVIRLLDDKPRPEHQAPNGIEQRWPTEAPPTLERSLADHQEHPRACPDTSTRLAHDAADQKPFHVSSKEPSFGPNFGQESSQRGARNTRQKPVRASESTPDLALEPNNIAEIGTAGASPAEDKTEPCVLATKVAPMRAQSIKSIRDPSSSPSEGVEHLSAHESAAPTLEVASRSTPQPRSTTNGADFVSPPKNAIPAERPASRSASSPTATQINAAANVLPESAIAPRRPVGNGPLPQTSAKDDAEADVSTSPINASAAPDRAEKVGDEQEDVASVDNGRTSDHAEEPLFSFFGNTSPRRVGIALKPARAHRSDLPYGYSRSRLKKALADGSLRKKREQRQQRRLAHRASIKKPRHRKSATLLPLGRVHRNLARVFWLRLYAPWPLHQFWQLGLEVLMFFGALTGTSLSKL